MGMCYVNLSENVSVMIRLKRVRLFFIDEKNNFFYPVYGGGFLPVCQRGGG